MNKNVKKGLLIGGIVLDIGITVFLLVVSIIMLATMPKNAFEMEKAPYYSSCILNFPSSTNLTKEDIEYTV